MAWYIHEVKKQTHISFDPGVKNFAFSVTRNNQAIAYGMMKSPVDKFKPKKFNAYEHEMSLLLQRYQPTSIGVERFMIRGFLSFYVELIGIMLGVLKREAKNYGVEVKFFTAASWKLAIKKHLDLKQFYKDGWKKPHRVPPHILDTLCTTRYIINGNKFVVGDKEWLYKTLEKMRME